MYFSFLIHQSSPSCGSVIPRFALDHTHKLFQPSIPVMQARKIRSQRNFYGAARNELERSLTLTTIGCRIFGTCRMGGIRHWEIYFA